MGTPVSSTNNTGHHITEILLKVVLNTITLTLFNAFIGALDSWHTNTVVCSEIVY